MWRTPMNVSQLKEYPLYTISDTGKVFVTSTGKEIGYAKEKVGLRVKLTNINGEHKYVNLSKLVANTFLEDTPTRYVLFKDGNKYNPAANNLFYGRTKDTLKYLKETGEGSGKLTQASLMKLFEYNQETGIWYRISTGKEVGFLTGSKPNQYLTIEINDKPYKLHRLAFLYMLGEMPNVVDHINHNTTDNRWSNLRNTDVQGNARNIKYYGNSSGTMGVVVTAYGKYLARITVNAVQITIGTFMTLEEARDARKQAETAFGFHTNHGS
jgi:hypothetical protein